MNEKRFLLLLLAVALATGLLIVAGTVLTGLLHGNMDEPRAEISCTESFRADSRPEAPTGGDYTLRADGVLQIHSDA